MDDASSTQAVTDSCIVDGSFHRARYAAKRADDHLLLERRQTRM